MHSYPGGSLPDDQLQTYLILPIYAILIVFSYSKWISNTKLLTGSSPSKPIIATETGYITSMKFNNRLKNNENETKK
jgi:hypothetical protein